MEFWGQENSPNIGGSEFPETCEGVVWVKVGLGKSLCLCQVQPRLVPWGAKLCKPCHSGFLHRWWFLPGPNASQEIGLPSTGPVLGRVEPSVLAQYWANTGQHTLAQAVVPTLAQAYDSVHLPTHFPTPLATPLSRVSFN